jgi:AraC-like DNA-binding protein
LTRCQFVIPFADILDDLGAPTEALLSKCLLPTSLGEKGDLFVPILPTIRFAEMAQRSQGILDFGFQAARNVQFAHLSDKVRALIVHSPTLLSALRLTCKWASLEDTNLSMWLECWDDQVRVCSKLIGTEGIPHLEHSQWLQLVFPIHIVRHFAGAQWNPATIAFEAQYVPGLEAQAAWPDSRFLAGQHASWIDVPVSILGRSGPPGEVQALPDSIEEGPSEYELVSLIKLMLPSYLDEGPPALAEVAEMAGLSGRSLQRKLSQAGFGYSDLVDAVRFDNARKLLHDTDSRIIDIALSSGYTDHAHFTRAFRRMTGVSPREFRAQSREASPSLSGPC